jgi:glycerol kinase
LCAIFDGQGLQFPEVIDSSGYFGEVDFGNGWTIPWTGSGLDQSIALLGQACSEMADTKITYGTCAELWYIVGSAMPDTSNLSTSISWQIDGIPTYAIVGEAGTAGAMVNWLRERFRMLWINEDLSDVAQQASGQPDLVFVAALTGLDAPHWVPDARGTIYGLTGGVSLEHILRAGLDSIAFSVRDVLLTLVESEGLQMPDHVKADGGMAANKYLMQLQADILDCPVYVPTNLEATSLGAAFLAGLATGYYPGMDFLHRTWRLANVFEPTMSEGEKRRRDHLWRKAIKNTINYYRKDRA